MAVTVSLTGFINSLKNTNIQTETKWMRRRPNILKNTNSKLPKKFPIFISTDPTHTNPHHLKTLFKSCNHSYHRFPNSRLDDEEFDVEKLRVALVHSAVAVSVFCNDEDLGIEDGGERMKDVGGVGELLMRVGGGGEKVGSDGRLVGFGRAVSDYGLTASIHDIMVNPSLQGMGIGTVILKKIIRILTNSDIYDISALCSGKERFFFKACGFRENDILGSTTMMYTRSSPGSTDGDQIVKRFGRKLLLIPPVRELSAPSKTNDSCRGMEDESAN